MLPVQRSHGPSSIPETPAAAAAPSAPTDGQGIGGHPRLRRDFEKLKIRPQSWFPKATPKEDSVATGPKAAALVSPVAESSSAAVARRTSDRALRAAKVFSADDSLFNRLSFQANRPKPHWFLGRQVVTDALEDYISGLVSDAAYNSAKHSDQLNEIVQLKASLEVAEHKLKNTDADLVFYRAFHDSHQGNYERLAEVLGQAKRTAHDFKGQARQGLRLIQHFGNPVAVTVPAPDSEGSDSDDAHSDHGTFGPKTIR